MNDLLKKLNFKNQQEIVVLNAPESFSEKLAEFSAYTKVLTKPEPKGQYSFLLAFLQKQSEIDSLAPKVSKMILGDDILWMAYPKGSSKKYTSEINRDHGWQLLGEAGFEGVRQVAIDEDWSALRFRRAEFIKTMTRSEKMTMSEEGKKKIGKQPKKS